MEKISTISLQRLRLALSLTVALLVVYLLESLPGLRGLFQPLQEFTAMLAFLAIETAGLPVTIDQELLTHPDGFRVAISYGCTPLVPAVFLLTVLTFGISLPRRKRLVALTTGITLVTLLNLFRVIALYYIGVVSPAAYDLAHVWLGQGFIVLGTAVVACYWISTSADTQWLSAV